MNFKYLKMGHDQDPVTICPIGDIQWTGNPYDDVAVTHLQEHIARCLTLPNPWFIGLGDYVDNFSPSQRALTMPMRKSSIQNIQMGRKTEVEELYEAVLKPTSGRWLGLLIGHHMFPLGHGLVSTDHYLGKLLGTKVLGDPENIEARGAAMIGIRWPHGGVIRLYAHHGCGGSVYPYGPVTKLIHTARHWNADVFMIGHQSKQAVAKYDMIDTEFPDNGKEPYLDHQSRFLVGTGAWSKGFREGTVTYVEEAMLNPAGIGAPIISMAPTKTHGWRPNIEVLVK